MADFDLKGAAQRLAAKRAADDSAAMAKQNRDNQTARGIVDAVGKYAASVGKTLDAAQTYGGEARMAKGGEQINVTVNHDGTFAVKRITDKPLRQAANMGRALSETQYTREQLEEQLVDWVDQD